MARAEITQRQASIKKLNEYAESKKRKSFPNSGHKKHGRHGYIRILRQVVKVKELRGPSQAKRRA